MKYKPKTKNKKLTLFREYMKRMPDPILTEEEALEAKKIFDYNPTLHRKKSKARLSHTQSSFIKTLYVKYQNIRFISSLTGFSMKIIFHVVKGFIVPKSRKARKKHILSASEIERYKNTNELYIKHGTLREVANEVGLTKERVRQLLEAGEKYGLFKYIPPKRKSYMLLEKYKREDLIKAIKSFGCSSKICVNMGLQRQELVKLMKHYDINYADYRRISSMGKYMQKYSQIVVEHGDHPTATVMNSRKDWRAIWYGIYRYWGSLDCFRKEYGIEKPKMKIHPNTLKHWRDTIEKKKMIKNQKKMNICIFIREQGPIKMIDIHTKLGFGIGSVNTYIKELLSEGRIVRVGKGSSSRYSTNRVSEHIESIPTVLTGPSNEGKP